jgi:mannose-6-phosphate isomerase
MNKDILILEPIYIQKPWGGELLNDFYPSSKSSSLGEVWLVSSLMDNSNKILNEEYRGTTLYEFYKSNRSFFGIGNKFFPIMIKMIGAKDDLSIQVHPKPEISHKNDDRYSGKDESWYILRGENKLIYGLKTSKGELLNALEEMKIDQSKLFNKILVKEADVIDIPNGTVHALSANLVVYEVQTTSDTTYRLYDYDRLGLDGKPRQLHIDESLKVVNDAKHTSNSNSHNQIHKENEIVLLTSTEFYKLSRLELNGYFELTNTDFTIISIISGSLKVDKEEVKQGETLIVGTNIKDIIFEGHGTILITTQ